MRIRSKAGLQTIATAWGNSAEKWLAYSTLKLGPLLKKFIGLFNDEPERGPTATDPVGTFGAALHVTTPC